MSNDKTLATVKHGGCVQLGGWPSIEERARELLAAEYAMAGSTKRADKIIAGFDCAPSTEYALRAIVAALSAQPFPGGQDALLESLVARWRNHAEEIGVSDNLLCQKIANCTMRHAAELQAVLAARQPVGEPVCTDCRTPVMFECTGCSRSNYPPYMQGPIGEIVYSGEGGLQIEFYDGKPLAPMKLYAAPPAQAVDLGAVRALLQRRIEQWRSHLPANPDAPGTREIETKGGHDYNNDVRIYREGIAVMEEVLSKVDSQAVGNG